MGFEDEKEKNDEEIIENPPEEIEDLEEQQIEETIEEIKEDDYSHIDHMKDLIDKYNRAIKALSSFDKHLNTNHTEDIKMILWEYKRHLNQIGIDIVRDKELEINEDIFINKLIFG